MLRGFYFIKNICRGYPCSTSITSKSEIRCFRDFEKGNFNITLYVDMLRRKPPVDRMKDPTFHINDHYIEIPEPN